SLLAKAMVATPFFVDCTGTFASKLAPTRWAYCDERFE
ncbi:hypothetical protein PSYPI_48390, partial [Pseudomonas syringae pv. pisi str. 1704B]